MSARAGFGGWSVQQSIQYVCYGVYERASILFTDIIPGNITCVIPNAVSWAYRRFWTGSITCQTLTSAAGKTAYLFKHTDPGASCMPAVLLLHGEHSHPLTMLHLADIAQAQQCAVYSVYLPYDDHHPEEHTQLLQKSISQIGSKVVGVGHSRGAIEAAHEAYVNMNQKIIGVIAIAGRFRVIEPSIRPCRDSLKSWVNAVWEKLRPAQNLRVPFYQLAAKQDWCIDLDASLVRRDQKYSVINAGHLGVINHPDTLKQFDEWAADLLPT
jgi:predicted alpha/beta hydrolase family esterase